MMTHSETATGDRSVADLEREVDQERARLSATIDALQAKASMGNIVEEVMKVARENGGEMSRNLGRAVRDNPVPALLAGVGLAWLMLGSGSSSRRWDADETSGPDAASVYREGGWSDMDGGNAEDTSPGARDRLSGATAGARERASGFAEEVSTRASHFADAVGGGMTSAREAAQGAGHSARSALHHARRSAMHGGAEVRDVMDEMIEEQPLVLGALAFAVGAAVGGTIPTSRAEDRMFGARAERAREMLRQTASEQGEKLGATLGAVAEEARQVVGEAAHEISERLPDARTAVGAAGERISEASERVRNAGAEEAERQGLAHPKTEI